MDITFGALSFKVLENGKVALIKSFGYDNSGKSEKFGVMGFADVELAGGSTTGTINMHATDEDAAMRYVSHAVNGDTLTIVQRSQRIEAVSTFTKYNDTIIFSRGLGKS